MSLTNPNKVVTEERLHEFYGEILPYLGGMPEAVSVKDDLPVGTTIYIDGKTVPEGWLLCDGSTKNISSYPALATYFQTQHGKKNYYGGNGTSTFGLPSIRRMPGNVSNELSTTEKVIGIFSDGKPLYGKVVTGTMPSTTTSGTRANSNIDIGASTDYAFCVFAFLKTQDGTSYPPLYGTVMGDRNFDTGYIIRNNINTANPNKINVFNANTNWNGTTVYFGLNYTKPTDSLVPAGHSPDGNGIWIIKAKTITTEDYSTDEKIVGTWIDGKPIYQKTIDCGALQTTQSQATKNWEVSHGVSNIDTVVGQKTILIYGSLGSQVTNNIIGLTNADCHVKIYCKKTGIYFEANQYYDPYITKIYSTIQYTKTS